MSSCIIGTAGHIDHGKTELIKALTGRDTDTMQEEKARGITIDLGFTYFDLPGNLRAGIIDVPGHEKFLPNMLAGVCGMDVVLLVIALDEGIKPQTLEHMEILTRLDVRRGIVVLTKLDCVDREWVELMEEEIAAALENTVFAGWERIKVSSIRGDGIEELKQRILVLSAEAKQNRNTEGTFRMPVDRILSLEGRGTVIAGTVLEGRIREGEKIEIYPTGKYARIRSIQSHGENIACAEAGQRAALLVAGMKKEEFARGNVAAAPGTLKLSERLDVRLMLAKNTDRVVKNRMRVHLHIGTGQVLCRILLFGCEELKAGESGYAQLLLEDVVAVGKRDRFVIRFYSPLETIGGGSVLDECPEKHKRSDKDVLARMERLEENKGEQILVDTICNSRDRMLRREELEAYLQEILKQAEDPGNREYLSIQGGSETKKEIEMKTETDKTAEKIIDTAEKIIYTADGTIIWRLRGKKTDYFASADNLELWHDWTVKWLEPYRKKHPYQNRIPKHILKKEVFPKWDSAGFDIFLKYEEMRNRICIGPETIFCFEYPIIKDQRFEKIRENLICRLSQARFRFTDIRELCPEDMPKEMYQEIVRTLEEEGELVQISDVFYTTASLAQEIAERVETYFQEHEVLTYTALKDMLETTRRSVRELAAYLDAQNITAPCGKETERRKG